MGWHILPGRLHEELDEGWKGRKPWERQKGGAAWCEQREECESCYLRTPQLSPPCPSWELTDIAILGPVQYEWPERKRGIRNGMSQIPIPRALTEAVRGWRGRRGDL